MIGNLFVIAQIAGRRCAFSALDVKSVIELGAVTPVPRTPDYIAGITAVRSQMLTVIDCRLALGFGSGTDQIWPTDDRAAVASHGGHSYALVVDGIEDITTAVGEPGQIPGGFGAQWLRVTRGMIETMVGPALLVDIAALIDGPEANGREFETAA
jgi:purine-binding chemotaxis protein CheW